jgi:hypothetical protein
MQTKSTHHVLQRLLLHWRPSLHFVICCPKSSKNPASSSTKHLLFCAFESSRLRLLT